MVIICTAYIYINVNNFFDIYITITSKEDIDDNNIGNEEIRIKSPSTMLSPKRSFQHINLLHSKIDKNLLAVYKILKCNSDLRILVVDDQAYNIIGVRLIFEKLGITVDGVSSGEAALARLDERQRHESFYEILFIDVNMPGMDGLEVTRRVRAQMSNKTYCGAKIIQCTAYTSEEDIKNCLKAGADEFLGKPVTVATLRDCLQKLFLK